MSHTANQRTQSPTAETRTGRRSFLVLATWVTSAAVALVALVPGLGFLVGPARKRGGAGVAVRVAVLSSLPPGVPVRADVVATRTDAWNRFDNVRLGAVWLVRSADGKSVAAYSTVCPHLGCAIDAAPPGSPDRDRFVCPCHGSHFALDGTRTAGPSPRGMDALEVQIAGDDVRVVYQRFRQGRAAKVSA